METKIRGGAIGEALAEAYDSIVAEYRPYLQAVPEVLGVVSKDIAPLITAFYKVAHTLRTDETLLVACEENDRAKATGWYHRVADLLFKELKLTSAQALTALISTSDVVLMSLIDMKEKADQLQKNILTVYLKQAKIYFNSVFSKLKVATSKGKLL